MANRNGPDWHGLHTEEMDMASERDEMRGTAETAQIEPGVSREEFLRMLTDALREPVVVAALGEIVRANFDTEEIVGAGTGQGGEPDDEPDVPVGADHGEGHPVNPRDGLS